MLLQLVALDFHVLTWFSDALLIAGLIWVLDRAHPASRSRWLPVAGVVGLVVSLNLASDPLLYAGGIVPLVVGATFAHVRTRSRQTAQGLRYSLLTSAIAIVGSLLVSTAMSREHIVQASGYKVALASLSQVHINLSDWVGSIRLLGGEPAFATTGLAATIYTCAADLLLLAVVLIPVYLLAEDRARPPRAAPPAHAVARHAFIVAWSTSALLFSAAFIFSTAAVGTTSSRYLIGVAIAAMALLPLQARSRLTVALVVAAASVYCASGVVSLTTAEGSLPPRFTAAQVKTVLRLARQERVQFGYAGYWQASTLTWLTDFRLQVHPAVACGNALCQFAAASTSGWYRPHAHQRSFLITDTATTDAGQFYMPFAPTSLGRPIATFTVGKSYDFVVYGYDIANRITRCLHSVSASLVIGYVPECPRPGRGAAGFAAVRH
jgi:hypothetical protein